MLGYSGKVMNLLLEARLHVKVADGITPEFFRLEHFWLVPQEVGFPIKGVVLDLRVRVVESAGHL